MLAWLVGLVPTLSTATGLPPAFSADYAVSARGFLVGTTNWTLSTAATGVITFATESKASGLAALLVDQRITARSELRETSQGLQPSRYRYDRTGKKARVIDIRFDWDAGIATMRRNAEVKRAPAASGTLDRLSYILAIMLDLCAGKSAMAYAVADGKKISEYALAVTAEERLTTPLGTFDTLKIERVRSTGERQTTVWAAPALAFLPVKVTHKDKDETVVLNLQALSGIDAKP